MRRPVSQPQKKLKAIRRAVAHSFPAGDIARMLNEIGQGYEG
jgi:hypothetical protein